jgi:hypothetical protein
MPSIMVKTILLQVLLLSCYQVFAQDTSFQAKHKAIFYPYPMYHEHWRSSLGFNLLTTPEDVTGELRVQVPTLDYHVLRRISNHLVLDGRLFSQVIQNHFSAGLHWRMPLWNKVYFDAGNDVGYWFGILKVSGYNSKASGWLTYPNFSIGFRTRRDLLITFKGQVSYNLFYKTANGDYKFTSTEPYYNGETFTIALEQPFYNNKHVTLALSSIRNRFYWQTWSQFYRTDRKVFYPQLTVGFIL